ncbi:MAG: hypothetical protein PUB07_02685 [Clostridia bacterium]|nr:hypothetical protein [Clostridia bacterium]
MWFVILCMPMLYALCAFFYVPLGLEKNRAEWTNCAKATGFGLPEGVHGYAERRSLFIA